MIGAETLSAKAGNDGNVRIKTEGGAHVILISESAPQVGGCKEETIKVYVEVKDGKVVGVYISRMRGNESESTKTTLNILSLPHARVDESQIGIAVPSPHTWGYPLPILAEAIFCGRAFFVWGCITVSVSSLLPHTEHKSTKNTPSA